MSIETDLSHSFQALRDETVHFGLAVLMFGLLVLSIGYITGALLAGIPLADLLSLLVAGVFLPITMVFVLLADARSDVN